ncbi:T9SS type A sorting domain-containing protein [Marinilabilia rubra]|uniref:Secretion system C-terminal sorting domain-containing protein n=1 Tax=Marinilabilia rubra TaxID=2162893 RepID=A0A2U2B9L6_9BACT|nr:T9SS type A sorting domain-containing protein [Marinilabilia rubra]PWD99771.1 hypothetical protein DDZ16_07700 [Marinilabilia rubra]
MNRVIYLLGIIIFSMFSFSGVAQTGPGGIGNVNGDDGQPILLFWLNADSLSLSDNDNVSVWNDLSGNSYDFSQAQISEQPVFKTSSINGHSAIEFDGSDMSLIDDDGESYFNGLDGFSFFAVVQSDVTNTDAGFFDTEDPDGGDDVFAVRYDDSGANGGGDDVIKIGVRTGNGQVQIESSENIQTTSPQLISSQWTDGGSIRLFVDGSTDVLTDDDGALSGTITNSTKLIVGQGPKDANGSWDGKVAEVFLFAEVLNSASRAVLENYISQKYAITIANDYFSGGDPAWVHNISGLGKESDGAQNQAYSAGLTLFQDGDFDNGDYLFLGHNNAVNNEANIRYGSDITGSGAESAWKRDWYVEKTGSLNSQFVFNIAEGFENGNHPHSPDDYVLLYRSGTTGAYSQVTTATSINGAEVLFSVPDADLQNGYYTFGSLDQTGSPVQGQPGKIWYSLVSGDWDNWEIWTLDPSGALPDNPNNLTPSASNSDKVVILNGRTVDVTSDNLNNASIEVNGRLDLNATTGHSFGEISGNGRILIQADNFPSGDASAFNAQGNGTVELYGAGYDLTTSQTFNDVVVEMDAPTTKLILETDYTIVGNLTVKTGDLQINDNANTNPLMLDVAGDVTVNSNGRLSVGTADAYSSSLQSGYGNYHKGFHQFRIGGNFLNNGVVRLTNLLAPDYNSRATNGAVSMVFYGASNKGFLCNNTTDLYNLVVDKGNDRTYELELYADDKAYFALFGENDEQWDDTDSAHPENRKALWIKNGTLRLTGSVFIPSLTEGSRDYTIGQRAGLVLDGPDVYVQNSADENTDFSGMTHGAPDGINTGGSQQGLYPYGKLQVSNGYFYLGKGEAINFRDEAPGIIQVDGGVLEANQIAISSSASQGNFSFVLNGGEVRVTDEYGSDGGRALLNLDNADMTFSMTGGALYVDGTSGHDPNGIHIASSIGNYNVSGGTVYINSGSNTEVLSTAPFYNLVINGGSSLTLQEPLTVLNDLEIQSNATLTANGHDVSIGGDFDLNDKGTYTHGGNTTRFIGSGRSNIYIRNTNTIHELTLNDVELAKDQRYNTSLFHRVEVVSNGRASADSPLLIEGNLTVLRGEFDVDEYLVDVRGNVEIVDGQMIATDNNPGRIRLNGSSQQTIKGALSKEQDFGHIELDNNNGALLLSDINVSEFTLVNGVMDLDVYNLDISGRINGSGYSGSKMFKTAGNASDGGLTLFVNLEDRSYSSEEVLFFPIGSSTGFNTGSVFIDGNPGITQGEITLKGVDRRHPAASSGNALEYYWVASVDGFDGINSSSVNYKLTYLSGFDNGWQVMKLLENTTDWVKNNDDATPDAYFYDVGMVGGDFTVGNPSGFNNLKIFYSRQDGDWSSKNTWSNESYGGAKANSAPGPYDIVKIGYEGSPGSYVRHRVTLNVGTPSNPVEIAALVLEQNPEAGANESEMSRLIIPPTRGLRVNGKISGDGEVQFQMENSNIPLFEGDFGEFVETEGASFIMRSNEGNVIAPTNLTRFPRLSIPGSSPDWTDSRSVTFITDITCENLNVRYGGTLRLNDGGAGDVEVLDSLRVGGIGTDNAGRIIFPNSGNNRSLTVQGDLSMDTDGAAYTNNQIIVEEGGNSDLKHRLIVYGNIQLRDDNSLIDLFTNNDGQSNAILEITGEAGKSFEKAPEATADFYRIVMNKMENKSFSFEDDFTLNGPSDGDTKALELISGRLQLRDAGIDVTLSSGGADFRIPAEAELYTGTQSTVRVTGDNTGIWLDGKISIGWDTYWYINGGVNNYIEYTASGNSTIVMNQGHLYVGSQIRRNPATEDGILHFNQNHSNSEIVIGSNADQGGEAARGMLELLNTSTFSQVDGAELIIANSVANSSVPSFYLDIANDDVTLGAGSSITFGNTDTGAAQSLGLYSSVPLENVIVNNVSGNNPEVLMQIVPLELNNLTVDAGAVFNANGLDLTLNGNFTNDGDFVAGGNNTFFTGLTDQTLSGNTTFYNLQKDGSTDFILSSGVTAVNVANNMSINQGSLIDNSNTVFVQGDVFFDGIHQYGGAGKGVSLNGSNAQLLSGNGTFGKLTINNSSGVNVPLGNDLTIINSLRMERGIFNIDKNLLALGENCEIEEVAGIAPFSASKMIQTNISFTDNGVKKILPTGAAGFVFPMGSTGKYTPVTFDITNNSATGGSIVVKPSNEKHPSVSDPNNVLQYHWVLRADGLTGFSATARMKYVNSDVEVEAPNTINDYWTARLLSDGSGNWEKYSGADVIDESNQELVFTFSGTDDVGISGDYTAGLETAIPDQVPGYITTTSGNWTDETIWDTYPVPGGTVPAGGPRGSMVYVDHQVTIPSNYVSSYRTTINAGGEVVVGQTFGHRFGEVDGEGILKLESGNLPAGIYDNFLLSGTFEFTGNGNYDVLSSFSDVNNLIFSGTGERRLPNIDLQINGNVLLSGADLINEHNRSIGLGGDFEFNSGTFDAGTGSDASWIFNGNALQYVTGLTGFIGGNTFYNFGVNNTSGIVIETDVEIDNSLSLTSGVINNSLGNRLALMNASSASVTGGSSSSYITGPFEKLVNNGSSFTFPMGAGNRYGELEISSTQTGAAAPWQVRYFNADPGDAGFDPESYAAPIEFVSRNEYWNVKGPDGANAHVTVRWDSQSGVSADAGERDDLRLVSWEDQATDRWEEAGSSITDNGQNSGNIQSDALLNFNEFVDGNYYTIGGVQVYNYSWIGATDDWFVDSNWASNTVPSISTEVSIPEVPSGGNQPVINGDAFCKDLSLEANSSLTLRAGSTLEIANDVDNSGTIVLESTNSSLSSLMLPETMTNSGNVNVKLTLDPDHYWYMSSPLQNTVAGWFKPSEDVSKDYVYVFEVVDNRWQWIRLDQSDVDNNRPIGDMQGIVGYYYTDTKHLDYTGTVQNTDLTVTPDDPGYHLVGNPYPTAIDWEDPAGWTRAGFSNTIWSWINYGGERIIQTYNNNGDALPGVWTLEPNGYDASTMSHIPPYQSVWMKQESETAVPLTVKRAARVKNSDAPLKSASSGDGSFEMIRIKAENAHTMDATVLYFNGSFITGKGSEDSEKRFNGSEKVPEVYTSLNTQALAINGQPLLSAEENAYALSVRNRVEGEVRLVFDLDEFTDVTYDVLLEDKVTGAWTDLRDINEYAYTPVQMGDDHDRFVLHLDKVKEVPTSVENPESSAAGDITIVGKDEYALVTISNELLSAGNAIIDLLDMNGRLIERKNTTEQETEIALPDNSGMYIVKVSAGGKQKTEKVVGASL